ncbi:MAG TPA: TerB family tellurite resistance protein [Oligoflexia bacterium]|nr:TerB family tellurite resistance protein [Oligoflexia bacterium]
MLPLHRLVTTKAFLGVDAEGVPAEKRLRICVAALLWEMATVDGVLEQVEVERIFEMMGKEFSLSETEAATTIETVEYLKRQRCHLYQFLDEVNERFTAKQRERLYEMIWSVALADGFVHHYEKDFAVYLRIKLNLPRVYQPDEDDAG